MEKVLFVSPIFQKMCRYNLVNSLPVFLVDVVPRLLPPDQAEAVTGVDHVGALDDVRHSPDQDLCMNVSRRLTQAD